MRDDKEVAVSLLALFCRKNPGKLDVGQSWDGSITDASCLGVCGNEILSCKVCILDEPEA